MTGKNSDVDVYDVIKWLWSYRILALVCLTLGVAGFAFFWFAPGQTRVLHNFVVRAYIGGTPIRTANEIADIVYFHLTDIEGVNIDRPDGTVLSGTYVDEPVGDLLSSRISDLSELMISEVQDQFAGLGPMVAGVDGALEAYLKAEAFLSAQRTGLVSPLRLELSDQLVTIFRREAILSLVGALLAFMTLAGIYEVAKNFRRRSG